MPSRRRDRKALRELIAPPFRGNAIDANLDS
jgi:hypothetical protein